VLRRSAEAECRGQAAIDRKPGATADRAGAEADCSSVLSNAAFEPRAIPLELFDEAGR
jgi:hypothetical protein